MLFLDQKKTEAYAKEEAKAKEDEERNEKRAEDIERSKSWVASRRRSWGGCRRWRCRETRNTNSTNEVVKGFLIAGVGTEINAKEIGQERRYFTIISPNRQEKTLAPEHVGMLPTPRFGLGPLLVRSEIAFRPDYGHTPRATDSVVNTRAEFIAAFELPAIKPDADAFSAKTLG
jgi:hypothetical protein